MSKRTSRKSWSNMSNAEQRNEFLRRLPAVVNAIRDMMPDTQRRLFAAALLADADILTAERILASRKIP